MIQLISLTDEEFKELRELIYRSIGVNLTEAKKMLVISRLSKRLKQLRLTSIHQYLMYIKKHPEEKEILFNLITTNVTKFFRESHHFDYLTNVFLPNFEKKVQNKQLPKRLRIWSSASSTGEEPYTIAMVLLEYFKAKRDWHVEILASDINTETLKKASIGIYKKQEIVDIPYPLLTKYFKLGQGKNEGLFKVKDNLKELITFKRINLAMEMPYPIHQPLHIIFCRNVFIYFNKETQENIIRRFYNLLENEGLLILGHSESISREKCLGNWKLVDQTIYQKC